METYTVKEIAEMLNTNQETVRRWIRSGKLESIQSSRKEGNMVTQSMFEKFISSSSKYSKYRLRSPKPSDLIMPAIGVAGLAVTELISNSKDKENVYINSSSLKKMMEDTIKQSNEAILKKQESIELISEEIKGEREKIRQAKEVIRLIDENKDKNLSEEENSL